jgi:Tfp pilus assembly protein PilE
MLRWHLWRGMTFVTIILPVIVVGILFIAAHVAGRKQVPSPSQ